MSENTGKSSSIILANEGVFNTLQGEGKFIGYPSTFVRLSRCNLRCEWKNPDGSTTKCDTPYTSFDPELNINNVESVKDSVMKYNSEHVVISGGEPYFQKIVTNLIDALVNEGKFVTVETNGTIFRPSKANFISISPKLSSSSSSEKFGHAHNTQRLNYDSLSKFIVNHDYQFKFVVNDEADLDEIEEIIHTLIKYVGIDIRKHVWLMPQGTTESQFKEKQEWLWEVCKKHNFKYTDRLHIRVFGQRVGV